jgi:hypothetical protein
MWKTIFPEVSPFYTSKSSHMAKFTQGQNFMNVVNVENLSPNSGDTRILTLERKPKNAMNVGKHSTSSQCPLFIRELTHGGK